LLGPAARRRLSTLDLPTGAKSKAGLLVHVTPVRLGGIFFLTHC
jgi:hypothetical protein